MYIHTVGNPASPARFQLILMINHKRVGGREGGGGLHLHGNLNLLKSIEAYRKP